MSNDLFMILFIMPIYLAFCGLILWLFVRFVRAHEGLGEAAKDIARIYERQHNQQQKLQKQHDQP
jgi:hypothetical protein